MVWWLVPSLKVLVLWFYEEACSSSFLLIGVLLWGGPNDLGCTVPYLLNVYGRTLSSLEDNLKMANKGRNM